MPRGLTESFYKYIMNKTRISAYSRFKGLPPILSAIYSEIVTGTNYDVLCWNYVIILKFGHLMLFT